MRRRSFIADCCRAAGALFYPAAERRTAASGVDYHLHPRYREKSPFDSALMHLKPGLDGFVNEQQHDRIAAILDAWRVRFVDGDTAATAGLRASESHLLRPPAHGLEVRRLGFSSDFPLNPDWAAAGFSKIHSAEFQITAIEQIPAGISTRVRYELVGEGHGFYREQRVGYWLLVWQGDRLVRWRQAEDEVRSRAATAFYADVTLQALGSNPSYAAQFLHGADYWRMVLDGACGIDIYGHNGVSVGDIDGDGYDDIYVCQPAGLPNRLFRNRGNGTFEDITEHSGLGLLDNTACALIADFDNDGKQDVVVVRASGPLLFQNRGKGKFELKPDAFRFAQPPQGTFTGAAAADFDLDGRVDIYFCLYTFYRGADQYKYPTPYFAAENGPPNFLMRNNGAGAFSDVTTACGLDKNNNRYSFCCGWSDYNSDGWPDLYVVNDFGRKNLYRNNGDGTFTDVARQAGVEDAGAGMSVSWFADDLYAANMWTAAGERISADKTFQKDAPDQTRALYRKHAMGNSLFRRSTEAAFRDVTEQAGVGMGRWAWSSDSWDFDHDGFADIYVTNGMVSGAPGGDLNSFFWRQVVAKSPVSAKSDAEYEQGWNAVNELIREGHSWSGFERNVFYANNRDGTFSDVSAAVGLDFLEDGRAFALADFDGDGRQEVIVKNRSAPQLRFLKNVVPDLPASISFRLRGVKSNRDAIGASITIGAQTKMLQAGSGFLSQHSKDLFFGLGDAKGSVNASIRWPTGLVQQVRDVPLNHRISVTEGIEDFQTQAFHPAVSVLGTAGRDPDETRDLFETWLLVPVLAPMPQVFGFAGTPVLLTFESELQASVVALNRQKTKLGVSDDFAAVYNLLFRQIYDWHRDLSLPSSFLIDAEGRVVKVYGGPVEAHRVARDFASIPRSDADRLACALPFRGTSSTFEFDRNYLSLGSVFFQRGYLDPALSFFESAWKADPQSAEACYALGSVYLRQGKYMDARDLFERAVKLKAAYPDTAANGWNNLGLLAMRDGSADKAVSYFEEAVKANPDHFVALENLGNAYRQLKRWDEARATLARALALKPGDAEANYSLGMVYAQLDDSEKAYDYLQNALQIRPDYPEALNNLGVLYLRTRRPEQALSLFTKCIRVAPEFDQAYLNLARVYAIEADQVKAREVLQALLAKRPDDVAAQQALAQLGGK